MPGVTRVFAYRDAGLVLVRAGVQHADLNKRRSVSMRKSCSRGIDLHTNGSTDNLVGGCKGSRRAGRYRRCDAVGFGKTLPAFLSPLEMKGRHALATWCFSFPRARRLIKSTDGIML